MFIVMSILDHELVKGVEDIRTLFIILCFNNTLLMCYDIHYVIAIGYYFE